MKTANISKITTKTGAASVAALLLTAIIAGCTCGCSKKKANEIKDESGLVLSGKMPDELALKEIEHHNYYVERDAGRFSQKGLFLCFGKRFGVVFPNEGLFAFWEKKSPNLFLN